MYGILCWIQIERVVLDLIGHVLAVFWDAKGKEKFSVAILVPLRTTAVTIESIYSSTQLNLPV